LIFLETAEFNNNLIEINKLSIFIEEITEGLEKIDKAIIYMNEDIMKKIYKAR